MSFLIGMAMIVFGNPLILLGGRALGYYLHRAAGIALSLGGFAANTVAAFWIMFS